MSIKNEDGKLLIPGDILAALTVVRDSGCQHVRYKRTGTNWNLA